MSTYYLGIDVGTGGSKALLAGASGEVRAAVTTEYPLSTPHPLWSEQDPHDWWRATVESIRKALEAAHAEPSQIAGVGLTGQMHGLVLLDAAGEVLRPAILWNDQRTAAQCDEIHRRVGLDTVLKKTGKPALTGFTAPKILWVRDNEPEVFSAATKILLPKDYVRYRLTGELICDVADASGTSLFDVTERRWCNEITDALEVPRDWLPEVHESPVPSAKVNEEGAQATGLLAGTPVATGAGDQAAEAVGCGVVNDGTVSVTLGTSGVMFAATSQVHLDEAGKIHAYCHATPGMSHVMGVMLSAGGSLRWYRDTLGREEIAEAQANGADPYELLINDAANAPAGCEGLVFLPYLAGERTPYADPHARGAFIGLTLRHGKEHMTRSVLEGVTFGLCDSLHLMRNMGITVQSVRASGGGARSPFWLQMLADVFNTEIETVNATQGAAFGAALLAAVSVGAFTDVPEACQTTVRVTSTTGPQAPGSYDRAYQRYRDLYPTLAETFRTLAD